MERDLKVCKAFEEKLAESEVLFRGLFDTMPSGAAVYEVVNEGICGKDYIIKDFNRTSLQMEGKKKEDVVGKSLYDLRPNIDQFGLIDTFRQVWQTGQPAFLPGKVYRDDHFCNWYENWVFKLPSGEIVAIYNDVTERKRAEENLKKRLKYEQLLYKISSLAVNYKKIDAFLNECLALMGETLEVSRIYIFEYRQNTDIMDNTYEWVAPGIRPEKENLQGIDSATIFWWTQILKGNRIINFSDIEEITDKGTKEVLRAQNIKSILAVPLFIDNIFWGFWGFDDCLEYHEWPKEDIDLLLSIASIMTQAFLRKRAEQSLFSEKERLRVTLHSIGDGVITTDKKGCVTMLNDVAEQLTGWTQREAAGKPLIEVFNIINEKTRLQCENPVDKVLQTGMIVGLANHTALISKDGTERAIADSAAPIRDQKGNVLGVILVFRDVTQEKQKEEEIIYLSYHDLLTGLYNRAFFEKELERLDMEAYLPLSLIMGDVNGLKITNDVFGHQEGDRLLKTIARLMKESCRQGDIIARWAGDEFVILLPNTSNKAANEICEQINQSCVNKEQDGLHVSISLGCATKEQSSESILRVLKNAEDFMYKRKLLESKSLRSAIVSSMRNTLFEKSHETEEHAERLSHYCKQIGMVMGLSENELNELELLGMLHDIGKIGIMDSILTKPGPLNDEEWVEMKKHPEIGYRIAQSVPHLLQIAEYILSHHERWDGKGYPQGLEAANIPFLARILAVVDAYDAMRSDRVYRKALPESKAREELKKHAGTQFDPSIVHVFLNQVLKDKES